MENQFFSFIPLVNLNSGYKKLTHSTGSCRLEKHPKTHEIASKLGIRVISVDRPGYGRSDIHEVGLMELSNLKESKF